MKTRQLYSPVKRRIYALLLGMLLLGLFTAAAPVPFIWESKSLWYKLGLDRTLLQVGKAAGFFAALLLFTQILLASRQLFLDRVFGLDRLLLLHRYNGCTILLLGLLHVSLVILPEGFDNLPIGWKFWPEMIGALMLTAVATTVTVASFFRQQLPYHHWRMLHRPIGYLIAALLLIHVFFVSTTFDYPIPRYGFAAVAALFLLAVIYRKLTIIAEKRTDWQIEEKRSVTDEVMTLKLRPPAGFSHAPGQFAVLHLQAEDVSREPHPFTIASSPMEGSFIQFYIKQCGDWTKRLVASAPRHVGIEGPYGLFSYTAQERPQAIFMIAGGIGITPLLSMLRHMAEKKDAPKVTLLWSLRFQHESFIEEELNRLQKRIPSFDIYMIFTGEPPYHKIDLQMLKKRCAHLPADTHFYLCGPQALMRDSMRNLIHLGFTRDRIFSERFVL